MLTPLQRIFFQVYHNGDIGVSQVISSWDHSRRKPTWSRWRGKNLISNAQLAVNIQRTAPLNLQEEKPSTTMAATLSCLSGVRAAFEESSHAPYVTKSVADCPSLPVELEHVVPQRMRYRTSDLHCLGS